MFSSRIYGHGDGVSRIWRLDGASYLTRHGQTKQSARPNGNSR